MLYVDTNTWTLVKRTQRVEDLENHLTNSVRKSGTIELLEIIMLH